MNRPVVAAKRKRVFEPWDILRGRDVFAQRDLLLKESDSADLSHWAPNCSSFSRARERPIPGVRFPPKPLRTVTCPEGIPEVLFRLNPSKRRKLDDDTAMAKLSAERCIKAHTQGRSFSLEHPLNSLARNLPSWKHLESLQGVHVTPYHACMFDGGERRKAQVLIHNSVALGNAIGKVCLDPPQMQQNGEAPQILEAKSLQRSGGVFHHRRGKRIPRRVLLCLRGRSPAKLQAQQLRVYLSGGLLRAECPTLPGRGTLGGRKS